MIFLFRMICKYRSFFIIWLCLIIYSYSPLVAGELIEYSSCQESTSEWNYKVLVFIENRTDILSRHHGFLEGARVSAFAYNREMAALGHPYRIELIVRQTGKDPNKYRQEVEAATEASCKNMIAVFNVKGDLALRAIRPAMAQQTLVSFGHMIASSNNMFFTKTEAFTQASSYLELVAMVTHFILHRQMRRIGIMHTIGRMSSEEKGAELVVILKGFGLDAAGVFADKSFSSSATADGWSYEAEWSAFAKGNPQAVLLFGINSPIFQRFFNDLFYVYGKDHSFTIGIANHFIIESQFLIYKLPLSARILLRTQKILIAFTALYPNPKSDEVVVKDFFSDYGLAFPALAPRGKLFHTAANLTGQVISKAFFIMGGWMAFETLLQALAMAMGLHHKIIVSRQEFVDSLFANRMIAIGRNSSNHYFGPFTDNCSTMLGNVDGRVDYLLNRPACLNNNGAHDVFVNALDIDSTGNFTFSPVASIITPISYTDAHSVRVSRGLVIYGSASENVNYLRLIVALRHGPGAQFLYGQTKAPVYLFTKPGSYENVPATEITSHQDLLAIQKNIFASASMASITHIPLDPRIKLAVINPFHETDGPFGEGHFQRNIIRLEATSEQQALAAASWIYSLVKHSELTQHARHDAVFEDILETPIFMLAVNRIVDSKHSHRIDYDLYEKLRSMLNVYLASYLLRLEDSRHVDIDKSVATVLSEMDLGKPGAFLFVYGIVAEEKSHIDGIVQAMERHSELKVILSSDTVVLQYQTLVAAIPYKLKKRIYFFSHMAPWGLKDANAIRTFGKTLEEYYAATAHNPKGLRNPITISWFYLERFLQVVQWQIPQATDEVSVYDPQQPWLFDPATGGALSSVQITSENLLDTIYIKRYIQMDSVLILGPFFDKLCPGSPEKRAETVEAYEPTLEEFTDKIRRNSECERNYATGNIIVHLLAEPGEDPSDSTYDANATPFFKVIRGHHLFVEPDLPKKSPLIPAWAIYVVAFGLALLMLLALILGIIFWRRYRATRYAPKDSNKPVTIIFTDIQSSTSLWAEIPDTMALALDIHHELIRGLIKRHHGYEVKTIGDAFMVAFCRALDALLFASELQYVFFYHDWETTAGEDLEESYLAFERNAMEEILADEGNNEEEVDPEKDKKSIAILPNGGAAEPVLLGSEIELGFLNQPARVDLINLHPIGSNAFIGIENNQIVSQSNQSEGALLGEDIMTINDTPNDKLYMMRMIYGNVRTRYYTCNLSKEQYKAAWHGIRVRIGINSGYAEIKLDDISRRYDYYGNMVNVAARTEAVAWGGQVVVTDSTKIAANEEFDAMSNKEKKEVRGFVARLKASENDGGASATLPPDFPLVIQSFGPQYLRGVGTPVGLNQLDTLPGRYFGPLRLDVSNNNAGSEESGSDRTSTSRSNTNGSEASGLGRALRDEDILAGLTYVILRTLFSISQKKKRKTELETLCRRWRLNTSKHRTVKMMNRNRCLRWRMMAKTGPAAKPGGRQLPSPHTAAIHRTNSHIDQNALRSQTNLNTVLGYTNSSFRSQVANAGIIGRTSSSFRTSNANGNALLVGDGTSHNKVIEIDSRHVESPATESIPVSPQLMIGSRCSWNGSFSNPNQLSAPPNAGVTILMTSALSRDASSASFSKTHSNGRNTYDTGPRVLNEQLTCQPVVPVSSDYFGNNNNSASVSQADGVEASHERDASHSDSQSEAKDGPDHDIVNVIDYLSSADVAEQTRPPVAVPEINRAISSNFLAHNSNLKTLTCPVNNHVPGTSGPLGVNSPGFPADDGGNLHGNTVTTITNYLKTNQSFILTETSSALFENGGNNANDAVTNQLIMNRQNSLQAYAGPSATPGQGYFVPTLGFNPFANFHRPPTPPPATKDGLEEDDPALVTLATRISSVAAKTLPRPIRRLLTGAAMLLQSNDASCSYSTLPIQNNNADAPAANTMNEH